MVPGKTNICSIFGTGNFFGIIQAGTKAEASDLLFKSSLLDN
jgi:hypothetical protein